jgi:protein-tyrosine phosphatase
VQSQRIVPFTEVFNFRDLGGYRTFDGRTTRYGLLYRSEALQDLTDSDLERFRGLGIVTVVDLRSASEIQRTGRGRLANEPVQFVNASVLSDVTVNGRRDESALDGDYLSRRYLRYLEVGSGAFVRAIEVLAVRENYPIVFNCFFGKDRTGVLAALVLGCLGVERQSVVKDYALTATRVPLILNKLRRDPLYRETLEQTDPLVLAASATTMSTFLDDLDKRYGGARSWALGAGVTLRQLDILRDALLE